MPEPASEPAAAQDHDLAFYKTVQVYEHHFNQLEFEVRKLASIWLLASFGAIAFLFRGELDSAKSLFDPMMLLVMIAVLAQTGLFILWMLDQVAYHGLLDAVFTLALHIERRHPELPPIRSMMLRSTSGTGVAGYIKFFYLLPMMAFAAMACFAAYAGQGARANVGMLLWSGAALSWLAPLWVVWKSATTDKFKACNRAAEKGDASYQSAEDVIERWLAGEKRP
jgi:hypothetical protein